MNGNVRGSWTIVNDILATTSPRLSFQFNHMPAHGFAERFEVVAAFETGNQAAVATLIRPLLHGPRHVYKILIGEEQLAQGIAEVGIEAS